MTIKTKSPKTETATTESLSSPRGGDCSRRRPKNDLLELKLVPVPPDADNKVMELLYAMAMKGNITAAKLFLDYFRSDPDEEPSFTLEDAMKLLHDHIKSAA